MIRAITTLIGGAALYGAAIGLADAPIRAAHNVVKMPLLLVVTGVVSALAYAITGRALEGTIGGRVMVEFALDVFSDLALLLAALAPAVAVVGMTGRAAYDRADLGDYTQFLGLNMALVALCGSLALLRRSRALAARFALSGGRITRLVTAWLAITFIVGAQWAFYLRPFFGASRVDNPGVFIAGSRPDFRGARNFYEVVWQLAVPPKE
jgi:hypothetical protein